MDHWEAETVADDSFLVEVARQPDECVCLVLSGELDLAGIPAFEAAGEAGLILSDSQMHLDLTRLRFIDARGIGVISSLRSSLISNGGLLSIDVGRRDTRRTFGLCGLEHWLGAPRASRTSTRPAAVGRSDQLVSASVPPLPDENPAVSSAES